MADLIPTLMKQGHEDPHWPLSCALSVYFNEIDDQIDAFRRSYMELTTQVRLLTVKLANHYESLAVHADRSPVGFLMSSSWP